MATTVDTIGDIIKSTGLSGEVVTRGGSDLGDGGGLTYDVTTAAPPSGERANLALRTADGRYAVPQFTEAQRRPPRGPMPRGVRYDLEARAFSFMTEGGTDLVWDSTRTGPGLNPQPVHRVLQAPYPITCSHFTGLLLHGYSYSSTTYVADQNTRVGSKVSFAGRKGRDTIFQAHNQGRNLWDLGQMWVTDGSDIAEGDLLFFSQQDPESSWAGVRAGTTRPYWGNIYHVALYIGGNEVLQSATRTSPTGVYISSMDTAFLGPRMHLAARPYWLPMPPSTSWYVGGWEQPVG